MALSCAVNAMSDSVHPKMVFFALDGVLLTINFQSESEEFNGQKDFNH